jgi:hypothetical protein
MRGEIFASLNIKKHMTFSRYNFGEFNSGTYVPYRVDIQTITQAASALITTSSAHGFQVGGQVQFSIPKEWGMRQLDGLKGFVTEIPATTQFYVDIDTSNFDAFVTPSPPALVVIDPAQATGIGDGNFNQYFPNSNPKLPRTIQGAFVNQPP